MEHQPLPPPPPQFPVEYFYDSEDPASDQTAPQQLLDLIAAGQSVSVGPLEFQLAQTVVINPSEQPYDPQYFMDRTKFELFRHLQRKTAILALFRCRIERKPCVLRLVYDSSDFTGPMSLWMEPPEVFLHHIPAENVKAAASEAVQLATTDNFSKNLIVATFQRFSFFIIMHDTSVPEPDQVEAIMNSLEKRRGEDAAAAMQ